MQGTIKTLRNGYGFISYPGAEKDIFFHATSLTGAQFDSLREGQAVEFEIGESPKGPAAVNVKVTA
jgi:CspA family cold shock protein